MIVRCSLAMWAFGGSPRSRGPAAWVRSCLALSRFGFGRREGHPSEGGHDGGTVVPPRGADAVKVGGNPSGGGVVSVPRDCRMARGDRKGTRGPSGWRAERTQTGPVRRGAVASGADPRLPTGGPGPVRCDGRAVDATNEGERTTRSAWERGRYEDAMLCRPVVAGVR